MSETTRSDVTWGKAAGVIVVEVITLLALFALQRAFTS